MADVVGWSSAAPALAGRLPLYLSGEDGLSLTALNSAAGVTLTLRGRFLAVPTPMDPTPRVNDFQHTLIPATDRSASSTTVGLADGWLLDFSVIASAGSPKIGQCFAVVALTRGIAASSIALLTLAQGYVTGTQRLGWPGSPLQSSLDGAGALRIVSGTTPGAGAEIAEAVPTGARWGILAFAARLVTSAAVANRIATLIVDDGTTLLMGHPSATQTASITNDYPWVPGSPGTTADTANMVPGWLPVGLELPAAARLRTLTTNIQAADQWSNVRYLIRERIEG